MNSILCRLQGPVDLIFYVYYLMLLVYALASWIPDMRGRWLSVIARFIEPALVPIRQIIPPIGGFDLAFIVLLIFVRVLHSLVDRSFTSCFLLY